MLDINKHNDETTDCIVYIKLESGKIKQLNITRMVKCALEVKDKKSSRQIGAKLGISHKLVQNSLKDFDLALKLYNENDRIRHGFSLYEYETYDMVFDLKADSLKTQAQIKKEPKERFMTAVGYIIYDGLSETEAVKKAGISKNSFEDNLKKDGELYVMVKAKTFENRTGSIERVIKSSRLFVSEDKYSYCAIARKDNIKCHGVIKFDVEKRLFELHEIYNESKFIRDKLEKFQIKSFSVLEELCRAVIKELNRRAKSTNRGMNYQRKIFKKITICTDYIEKSSDLTMDGIGKQAELSSQTTSLYIKGHLRRHFPSKAYRVINRFKNSQNFSIRRYNSYHNDLL